MNKYKFVLCLVLFSALVVFTQPIFAESSATVTATVQTELISLTADVTSIDYGTVNLNSSKRLDDAVTITNNGNVNEKIEARGADAVERSDNSKVWALNAYDNIPSNTYRHWIAAGLDSPVKISTSLGGIVQNLPPTGSNSVKLSFIIDTPPVGSYGGKFDTTVFFTAIKAL